MSEQPAVEVSDLSHRYGSRIALDGVSLEIEPGVLFGLLGPNGGGKTTLVRILSTSLRPSHGTARIAGLDVATDRQAVRAQIGVAFQNPGLDKHLTVEENLRCQASLYGLSGSNLSHRLDHLLNRFYLKDRRQERVKALSGGLARRVELCKALLHEPAVLLLDEPSTGLDPIARRELMDLLTEIRTTEGTTVLLTTHIMDEADRCDRVAILDQGHIVACDSPVKLKSTIGGEVISIKTSDPESLSLALGDSFGPHQITGDRSSATRNFPGP